MQNWWECTGNESTPLMSEQAAKDQSEGGLVRRVKCYPADDPTTGQPERSEGSAMHVQSQNSSNIFGEFKESCFWLLPFLIIPDLVTSVEHSDIGTARMFLSSLSISHECHYQTRSSQMADRTRFPTFSRTCRRCTCRITSHFLLSGERSHPTTASFSFCSFTKSRL